MRARIARLYTSFLPDPDLLHRDHVPPALVAWRNRRATVLRILAPLFFLLLALLIDRALSSQNATDSSNVDVKTPTDNPIQSIPSCHSDLYIAGKNCVELLYSPNTSSIAQVCDGMYGYVWMGFGMHTSFLPSLCFALVLAFIYQLLFAGRSFV